MRALAQLHGDELGDETAAQDHDIVNTRVLLTGELDESGEILGIGDYEDLVSLYEDITGAGNYGLLLALDGGDAHWWVAVLVEQRFQRLVQER